MSNFVGTPTIPERLHSQAIVFKAMAKRLAQTLRCGLPGKITAFDPNTQYASVQLTITENINGQPTPIPVLDDVLVLFPGDAAWCITFPSLIGAECYVCFADMCISAWATNGGVQNQEATRRHDLSDGFAILSPRSQPNVIQNYSTTALEIRSLDNATKISMDATNGIVLKGSKLQISGPTPVASVSSPDHSLPITVNGVTYYLKLSTAP